MRTSSSQSKFVIFISLETGHLCGRGVRGGSLQLNQDWSWVARQKLFLWVSGTKVGSSQSTEHRELNLKGKY